MSEEKGIAQELIDGDAKIKEMRRGISVVVRMVETLLTENAMVRWRLGFEPEGQEGTKEMVFNGDNHKWTLKRVGKSWECNLSISCVMVQINSGGWKKYYNSLTHKNESPGYMTLDLYRALDTLVDGVLENFDDAREVWHYFFEAANLDE
jgi:hypothetical protein